MAKYRCKLEPPLELSSSWMLLKNNKIKCYHVYYIWSEIKYSVRIVQIDHIFLEGDTAKVGEVGEVQGKQQQRSMEPVNMKDCEK